MHSVKRRSARIRAGYLVAQDHGVVDWLMPDGPLTGVIMDDAYRIVQALQDEDIARGGRPWQQFGDFPNKVAEEILRRCAPKKLSWLKSQRWRGLDRCDCGCCRDCPDPLWHHPGLGIV